MKPFAIFNDLMVEGTKILQKTEIFMEDRAIVDLYWAREERAISETDIKYGRMLSGISYSLLSSHEDSEECLNDTYVAAWNSMPSARPDYLGAFLSKIIRRLSVDRWRRDHRQKRDGGVEALLDELAECIPDANTVTSEYDNGRLRDLLNDFVRSLTPEKQAAFIRRYFYSEPLEKIADTLGITESKLKSMLFRIRGELKKILEKEELL